MTFLAFSARISVRKRQTNWRSYYSRFAGRSWHFTATNGEKSRLPSGGNFSAGISSLLCDAAVVNCGITMVPEQEQEARHAREADKLVKLLPDYEPQRIGYLSREHQSAALRLLLDELQSRMLSSS